MSEKIVRFKYKSDIINCIEGSWAYYGKEDEQRKVIEELKNVYKIASSAKNAPKHEYEAKAKAWDSLKNNLEKKVEFMTNKVSGSPYVDVPIESTIGYFEHVLEMMKNYESGESNAKK